MHIMSNNISFKWKKYISLFQHSRKNVTIILPGPITIKMIAQSPNQFLRKNFLLRLSKMCKSGFETLNFLFEKHFSFKLISTWSAHN